MDRRHLPCCFFSRLPAFALFAAIVFESAAMPSQLVAQVLPALSSTDIQPAAVLQVPAEPPQASPLATPTPAATLQPPPTPEELGDSLMSHHRYQAAIEAYRKAKEPSAEVWNKMGIAFQQMFNLEEAMHCYQASLRLSGKSSRVMNNLGTIYDSQRQFPLAERMYRKALKLDPQSALINKNLGTNQLAQHHYKKGWESYKTALQLDPHIFQNSASPRVMNPASVEMRGAMNYYMAKGCVRAGMNDCAIDYLRMALNEGFTNPKKIQADNEFAALHGVAAFEQLLASQQQQ